jgi:hypothetical protein
VSSPRAQDGPALALSLALACAAAGIAGWAGAPVWLGTASLAVIVLALAFGWKPGLSGGVIWSLTGIFVLFSGLIAVMIFLDDPAGPPRLWLGLPAPTALLVYGVWPLGVLPSLLYAFRFRDTVLAEDRLERFLAAHSRHKKG